MKRTTIYLSDKIKSVIRPNEENLSGRLSCVSDRYASIIKKHSTIKTFNESEVDVLIWALGDVPMDHSGVILAIPVFVNDYLSHCEFEGRSHLFKKLENLSFVQLVALAEDIELLILKESK